MYGLFKKVGVAIAFSPRGEALLTEANRIRKLFAAELVLIHVGQRTGEAEAKMEELLSQAGIDEQITIKWEQGKASERILKCCKEEGVDLIVAGALKQENMLQYYMGSVARKILRRADCSVLMLTAPSKHPQPFSNIVVNAEDSLYVDEALKVACAVSLTDKADWLHVVREIKLYGLTMSIAEEVSEEKYDDHRQQLVRCEVEEVEKLLSKIPHEGVRINTKILAGKSGYELGKFALKKRADLLVVGAPSRRFFLFDRMFPHDLEYIFADLPCNLFVVRSLKKKNG